MKTIILEQPGKFKDIVTAQPGAPGPDEVLVRVLTVGICGTDLHAFEGTQPFFTYPRILGHELAVEVVEPDDAIVETQLAQEISTLWSDHVRLSAGRRATSKELRLLRARLAERLFAMKQILCRAGRAGQWSSWLRQQHIPRSTADRLAMRHAESLGGGDGNVPTGAIPEPAMPTAENLAAAVWSSSLKKVLVTGESVFRFLASIAQISGIPHEQRQEGLMIFNPVPKAADDVTASAPATDLAPQPPQGGNAVPAETSAAEPAPQPSCETPASVEQPAAETAATPLAAERATAVADAGGSDAA
jgi:hypothetical protein